MSQALEIYISDCTKNVETCPVVLRVFEHDAFEEQIQDFDEGAKQRRQIFGDYVVACANGNCPGQDPRLANQIVKRSRGEIID